MVPTLLSLGWIAGVLAVPLFNRRRQRLGDLIAGTYVIHLPMAILLKDMAQHKARSTASSPAFRFLPHHLEHYGAFELQALEGFLRESDRPKGPQQYSRHRATLAAVVEQIRKKIEYSDAVPEAEYQSLPGGLLQGTAILSGAAPAVRRQARRQASRFAEILSGC